MFTRAFFRTTAVAGGVALLGLISIAPAAYAGPTGGSDVTTPGWNWSGVQNDGLEIEDLGSYWADFQGTGVALHGWSDDGFDYQLLGEGTFSYPGYSDIVLNFDPVSETYVNQGLSTILGSQQLDFGDGITFTVSSTMQIQGSYARWAVSIVSTGTGDTTQLSYDFQGNLGSDDATVWVPGATGQYVSYQDPAAQYWSDPILGWKLTTTGTAALAAVNGSDAADVVGTGDFTLTVVAAEWDVCSLAAALAGVTAALPTLDSTFGGTLPTYYTTNCWALASPASAAPGTPIDYTISLNTVPAQFGAMFDLSDADYLDYIGFIVKSAPAGVTVTAGYDLGGIPYLHVVGVMPSTASTIEVVLYSTYNYPEGAWPFISTIQLDPILAATGTSEETPWIGAAGAALVLAGTGVLMWRRRV